MPRNSAFAFSRLINNVLGHSFRICHFKTVDSTNTVAKNGYAKGEYLNGSVILTDTQVHGRGQMRTKWHDEPERSLLFTLIYEPYHLPVQFYFRLNQAVSLAIVDVLPAEILPLIKWPNDVNVAGKKIAGTLVETSLQGKYVKTVFIGIGLNLNVDQFPKDFVATSLKNETGKSWDRIAFLDELLNALDFRLGQIQSPKILSRHYMEKLMGMADFKKYQDDKGSFEAKIHHIEEDGRLVLKAKNESKLRHYRFKEVKMILD